MARIRASASADIAAPADAVYAILADYREGHPAILPPKYFSGLRVLEGGVGAGTVIEFTLRLMGRAEALRARVTEPVPGRVLAETDLKTGAVTTFTVGPREGGRESTVEIVTEWSRGGVGGAVERLAAPPLLRRMYAEELRALARRAEGAA